jgi:hypothetical protein
VEIALVVCGLIVFLTVWVIRVHIKSKNSYFSPTVEAVIRISLCILLALVAYLMFGIHRVGLLFWVTLIATSFLVYGITHFLDRLFLKQ